MRSVRPQWNRRYEVERDIPRHRSTEIVAADLVGLLVAFGLGRLAAAASVESNVPCAD